jgi:hypothetical protein
MTLLARDGQCKQDPMYVFPIETARPRSQFLHSCVCERFIHPTIGPPILLLENRETVLGIFVSNFRYSVFAVSWRRPGGGPIK